MYIDSARANSFSDVVLVKSPSSDFVKIKLKIFIDSELSFRMKLKAVAFKESDIRSLMFSSKILSQK